MNASLEFLLDKASTEQITNHLLLCDTDFVPPLSSRVEICDYAQKITSKATRFEAWSGSTLIGLVATYCNDQVKGIAYITNISVLNAWTDKGIATHLMSWCVEHAKVLGIRQVSLEVACDNKLAIRLYENCGFVTGKANSSLATMNLYLKTGEEHGQQS